jgi:hypothetical protein
MSYQGRAHWQHPNGVLQVSSLSEAQHLQCLLLAFNGGLWNWTFLWLWLGQLAVRTRTHRHCMQAASGRGWRRVPLAGHGDQPQPNQICAFICHYYCRLSQLTSASCSSSIGSPHEKASMQSGCTRPPTTSRPHEKASTRLVRVRWKWNTIDILVVTLMLTSVSAQ